MRYNKNGEAVLHRLGAKASFSEVLLTIQERGYELRCYCGKQYVDLDKKGEDVYGHPVFNTKHVKIDNMVEWLNSEMVDSELIKEEEPES